MRARTEPDEGHVVSVLQRSYYRRDLWARNVRPDGVDETWVDRNYSWSLASGSVCDRRCRFVYATGGTWLYHRLYRAKLQVGIDRGRRRPEHHGGGQPSR